MRRSKAKKNIITSLILQIVTIICGLILPRLIIKTYGSATNGLINSITQFLSYIALLDSGFGLVVKSLLYKPISEKNDREIKKILHATNKFFSNIAFIFLVYIIILCTIYPLIVKNQFDYLFIISLIIVLSISTISEYFIGITYSIYIQASQENYIISTIQIVTTILNTIISAILIKLNFSIQIVKLITMALFAIRPFLLKEYVKRKYKLNINHKEKSNYIIKQKWDGLAQHIAFVVHSNTDIAILSIFSTMKEVSVYSVYLLIINGIKKLVESFSNGIDASWGDMIAKKEHNNLIDKFELYEYLYHTFSTVIFTCTLLLITPFVHVYTKDITDYNYIRVCFGYIIVMAEFLWAIRLPYSSLVSASGKFKETRNGAIIEAVLNIIISMILVYKFGIIGVAIGTLISMTIRTIEFIIFTSRKVLDRNVTKPFLHLISIIVTTIICYAIFHIIDFKYPNSYISWIKEGVIVSIYVGIIVVITNMIMFRKETKRILNIAARTIKKYINI